MHFIVMSIDEVDRAIFGPPSVYHCGYSTMSRCYCRLCPVISVDLNAHARQLKGRKKISATSLMSECMRSRSSVPTTAYTLLIVWRRG